MNILDSILSAQGGAGVQQLGSRFNLNEGQTRSAIEALLPMLAGAVQRNASQPGGLEGLLGALSDGHHQRYLDDPSALQSPDTMLDGNAILGHLLGDKSVSREAATRSAACWAGRSAAARPGRATRNRASKEAACSTC